MKINKTRIPQLPGAKTLKGFSVLGIGPDGKNCRAGLDFFQDAVDSGIDTAAHPVTVGSDDYVYTWDKEAQAYVRTDIFVKGEKGKSPYEYYLEGGGDPSVTAWDLNELLSGMPGIIASKSLPLRSVVRNAASSKPLPGVLVSVYAEGRKIGAATSDAAGVATPRWFVTEQEYNDVRSRQENGTPVGYTSGVYCNNSEAMKFAGDGTEVVWFRTPKIEDMQTYGFQQLVNRSSLNTHGTIWIIKYASTDAIYANAVQGDAARQVTLEYDKDYIIAFKWSKERKQASFYVFGEKWTNSFNESTDPITGTSIGGKYQTYNYAGTYRGRIYGFAIWNRELSDTEVFNAMAGNVSDDSLLGYYEVNNITPAEWPGSLVSDNPLAYHINGETLSIFREEALKAVFSKEGYAGEVRYAQLPDYASAVAGGIDLSQAMRPGGLASDPAGISLGYAGGSRTVRITSPWPVSGAVPLAEWITLSRDGNTITATFAENIATGKRSSGIVVFSGDRRLSIPAVQEGMPAENHISFVVNSSDGTFTVPFAAVMVNRAAYSFSVYVNGAFYGTATGTVDYLAGSGYTVTGLTGPTATILLRPTQDPDSPSVGWGRAFGFAGNIAAGCNLRTNKDKFLRVLNDHDFAHCLSLTETGYQFRYAQFYYCINLEAPIPENLPDTIETISPAFRINMYAVTKFPTPAEEKLPDSVKTIGSGFRSWQYSESRVTSYAKEYIPAGVIINGENFRGHQYYGTHPDYLLVGSYIHDYRFPRILNSHDRAYYRMFGEYVELSNPDSMPWYYTDETETEIAPVTDITPSAPKGYVEKRTGIAGYAGLHPNWKTI